MIQEEGFGSFSPLPKSDRSTKAGVFDYEYDYEHEHEKLLIGEGGEGEGKNDRDDSGDNADLHTVTLRVVHRFVPSAAKESHPQMTMP